MIKGMLMVDHDKNDLVLLGEEQDYIFSCGEVLEVLIGNRWVPCRAEMNANDEWYLVGEGVAGCAGLTARI